MNQVNRLWMVIVTLILLGGFIIYTLLTLSQYHNLDFGMVIQRLDNETSRLATTLFFNKMTAMAQLAVALIGGSWAFFFLTDTKVKGMCWTMITCFILANISLVLSLYIYACGYDFIVSRIFYHVTFDIGAPLVKFAKSSQQIFFSNGCVDLVIAIIIRWRVP